MLSSAVAGYWIAIHCRGSQGYETTAPRDADDTVDAEGVKEFDYWQDAGAGTSMGRTTALGPPTARKKHYLLMVLVTGIVLSSVAADAIYCLLQSISLRIAVGLPESDDRKVVKAGVGALASERRTVKLSPIWTDNEAEALDLLGAGKPDHAVGRGDAEIASDAQTVVIERKSSPLIVAQKALAQATAATPGPSADVSPVSVPTPAPARPPTPHACDSLGPVGQFQNITPPGVNLNNFGTIRVLVDPLHPGTIIVGTDKSGLFRSADCGATWVKANTGSNSAALNTGLLWSIEISPFNSSIIYVGSLYGSDLSLLKSTQGGNNWASVFPNGKATLTNGTVITAPSYFFQDLALDPTTPDHLITTFHTDCNPPYGTLCLGESKDGGATWRFFNGPPELSGWKEGARPFMVNSTTWLYITFFDGVYLTRDSGMTWEKTAVPGGTNKPYKATNGNYYIPGFHGVHKSADLRSWMKVNNSPQSNSLVGDGVRIFAGYGTTDKPAFKVTLENNDIAWTEYSSPASIREGAQNMAYDSSQRILYTANAKSGLWRVVTK